MSERASLPADRSSAQRSAHAPSRRGTTRRGRLAAAALGVGLGLAALLANGEASADPGTVVLTTGEVLAGDIQQVVKGEYLIVKLPSGEVKAIAWTQIGSFNFGGSVSIGTPAPQPQPQPPPAPVYTPAPRPAPPPTIYTPPPPPPAYAPPPPPQPPPPPEFQPAFMLGVRLGSISPGGDRDTGTELADVVDTGWLIEGNVGYHFSPSWTFYGFWEHGRLGKRSLSDGASGSPTTNAAGIGMNANTSPRGPVGFVFDIALGYRWLSVPTLAPGGAQDDLLYQGPMPIRVGLGLSIVPTRKFRIDVLATASGGTFTRQKGGTCPEGCDLTDDEQATHTFTGVTAGVRWDL